MTEEKTTPVNYLDEVILEKICHAIAGELFQDEEPMGLYEDHDQGKVDSCLSLPRQAAYGQELYPGVFRKAAITFYAFNRNHAFGNGNKRLSVAALVVFLFLNDQALMVPNAVLRDKALWLAQTPTPIGEVVTELEGWLKENTIPLSQFLKMREEAQKKATQ